MNYLKKITSLSLVCLAMTSTLAQQSSNPDLNAMVEAERAFAKMAKEQNTRDAFLYYMVDNVITSGKEGPIIGKVEIRKQQIDNGWLKWDVAFADINNKGDLGYTTGPWEFRSNKTDKDPVAYGEFNSIWRKQSDGTWKNVCDIGASHGKGVSVDSIQFSAGDDRGLSYVVHDSENIGYSDQEFNNRLVRNPRKAYSKFLADKARIIRKGSLPAVTPELREKYLNNIERITNATSMGGYMPQSGDLGFTYGKATIESTVNGKKISSTATYLRVWKTYKMQYEIVLDVLTYQ